MSQRQRGLGRHLAPSAAQGETMIRQSFWRVVPDAALVLFTLLLWVGYAYAQTSFDCRPAKPALATGPQPIVSTGARIRPGNLTVRPELPVWKTITLGQYKGVNAIRTAMDNAPCPIGVGDWADEILGRPAFRYSASKIELDLVVVRVAELGFGEVGAPLRDIYARARAVGLALCPGETGPVLRLAYLNQPVGEFLHIAMEPVALYGGELVDFTLANGGAGLMLLGGDARPELVLPGAVRVVFAKPRPDVMLSATDPTDSGQRHE
jgi:hypothetical protein